jgi:hypothetical protein
VAPADSALCRSELERWLVIEEAKERIGVASATSRKIQASTIEDGLSNHQIDAVDQDAELQRVFSLALEGVVAQAPVIL